MIYEKDFYKNNPILEGMNPLTEARINNFGHLCMVQLDDRKNDLYIQSDSDIDTILDYLPEIERESIDKGYTVLTHCIPDDYFLQ